MIFLKNAVGAIAISVTAVSFTMSAVDAAMIADVNLVSHSVSVSGNTVSGSFAASSDMGNQDAVSYGLVMRSKKTGQLLYVSPILGKLSLRQGETVVTTISYKVPGTLPEAADVYLNLANATGVVLAASLVGELPGSSVPRICTVYADPDDGYVSCTTEEEAKVLFTIYTGGPHGTAFGTPEGTVSLTPGEETRIDFAEILGKHSGGAYILSGSVVSRDRGETEYFATDYFHKGTQARIGSANIMHAGGAFKATVMTDIIGEKRENFALRIVPSCGEMKDGITVRERVVEILFSPSCASGTADIVLYDAQANGNNVMDQVTASFSVPPVPIAQGDDGFMRNTALIAFIAIMFAAIYKLLHWHHAHTAPLPPTAAPKASRRSKAVIAGMLLAAAIILPDQTYAGTYAIDSTIQISSCDPECNEAGEIATVGSVYIPDSVVAGQTYTVVVNSQSAAGGGMNFLCQDSSTDGTSCDSLDVRTTASSTSSQGVTSRNVFHASSGNMNFTAPTTAQTMTVSVDQRGDAPYYFGCSAAAASRCRWGVVARGSAVQSVTVTASAPPVVDVRFSFLKSMFSAFALSR